MKFQNLKIVKLIRKNKAGKRNERNGTGNDGNVQPESNNQGQVVQRKPRGLSQIVDKTETTLYNGRHGTRSGRNIPGKVTQQRGDGVR